MSSALEKVDRLTAQLRSVKTELKETARVGTNSALVGVGGLFAGWCQAKYPVIPNTSLSTAACLGSGLVVAALTGFFDEYTDQVAAIGSGFIAVALAKEAEQYFLSAA